MIETEQGVAIDAPIDRVWDFAQDIRKWAELMPGLQNCDVIDNDNSRWTLKVGAGALVRTVKVKVNAHRWAGPEEVDFTYALEGDPVKGGGTYRAVSSGPSRTQLNLAIRVEGTGPMAPMWEAMGRPLLPKFARGFADQFKAQVEQLAGVAPAANEPRRSMFSRLKEWIRRLLSRTADAGR